MNLLLPLDTSRAIAAALLLGALLACTSEAGAGLPATCADYCAPNALTAANSCLPGQSEEACLEVCAESGGELAELTGCFLASAGRCEAMRYCEEASESPARFWLLGERSALMLGVIGETTPARLERLLTEHPDLQSLVLAYVPGSDDDDANLVAARRVRQAKLETRVPPLGSVASGGTDFLLAGSQRVVGERAGVGVHSWSDDEDGQGRDLPRQDAEHVKYLKYYRDMSIPEDFYWFTLEAAPSDGMHYMTREEMQRFRVFTRP